MTDLTEFVEDKNDKDEVWLPTKLVAEMFNVVIVTIINKLDKLTEGIHYIKYPINTAGGKQKGYMFSKSGRNELSFLLRTDEAKEHRELITIDPDRIMKGIELIIRKELSAIPRIEERVISLESSLTSPVEYSKLQKRFSDLRYELFKLGVPWWEVHAIAKGGTDLAKYDHMNIGQIQEAIRKLENEIKRRQK